MKNDDLKEYIGILADMENSVFLQRDLVDKLKTYSKSLGREKYFTKPMEPKPRINKSEVSSGRILKIVGSLLILPSVVIASIIDNIALLLVTLLGLFLFVDGFCKVPPNLSENERRDAEDAEKYKIALLKYEQSLADDEWRIKKEKQEKPFIDLELQTASLRLVQSEKLLQDMYNIGIVCPKYRDMVIINTIYGYLESGRCSTLEGAYGAYNVLESEKRIDRVFLYMGNVIAHLESSVRENQYTLYSAIKEERRKCEEIFQSIKDLSKRLDLEQFSERDYSRELQSLQFASKLNEYNSERVDKEKNYFNRIKHYEGNLI